MMGLILGFASLVIQKIWRDFAALGWTSAKGMDLLGNGSVMALGQAGKRWSWGRLYGCGIWHLKNAVTSRTQKSYMKKFAPRKGITRIVHDCTS